MEHRLSKSQLDKFVDCPRCFWLAQRQKLKQPDMISSKVWKGVERVTIAHYEAHRAAKTTPENLIGQVPAGAIPVQLNEEGMKALRYWGRGLPFKLGEVTITTALDDMLQYTAEGGKPRYAVIDYKSKSKLTDSESTIEMYQNQADVFDLACNLNNYPTDGVVYFDYWSPVSVEGAEPPANTGDTGFTMQKWASQVIAIKADHARLKRLIEAAMACLEGPMPPANIVRTVGKKGGIKTDGCTVCAYILEREEVFTAMKVA